MTQSRRRSARIPRVYFSGSIRVDQELSLPKQASHHLMTVLRLRTDAAIELFNGDGCNYRATLINTGLKTPGKCAVLNVHECYPANTESALKVHLIQAISRGDKMDTSIRQSVELGIASVQPLYTRHSAKVLDQKRQEKKMEHWNNIIVSACEQSGRAQLPELAAPLHLDQWLATVSQSKSPSLRFLLSPESEHSLQDHLQLQPHTAQDISLLIGPETGFDQQEIDLSVQQGIQPMKFGPRILRTETAGPACVASLQLLLGDLGNVSL